LRARIFLHGSCAERRAAYLLFDARCARFVVQGDDIGVFGREFRHGREIDR
jgi:hypothetical protein